MERTETTTSAAATTVTIEKPRPAEASFSTPTTSTSAATSTAPGSSVCELSPANFDQAVASEGLVLVDFYTVGLGEVCRVGEATCAGTRVVRTADR